MGNFLDTHNLRQWFGRHRKLVNLRRPHDVISLDEFSSDKLFWYILGTRILESKKTAAPAFSFGARHMNKNSTYGPGPAQYNITGLAAKGKDTPPQISLQSRAKAAKIIETPAPGEYHIEKSDKYVVSAAPKFTFGVKKYCGITNYETPGELFAESF